MKKDTVVNSEQAGGTGETTKKKLSVRVLINFLTWIFKGDQEDPKIQNVRTAGFAGSKGKKK